MASRSKLQDFEIISKLGSGSFGTVFKVKRLVDARFYVIKNIRIVELSFQEQQHAINEVQILAQLNSDYIVKYFDSFIQKDSLHIVMEYCNRGDLQNLLKKAKEKNVTCLKEDVIWSISLQVFLGLLYLHKRNILHRDLKSANVFLMKDESRSSYLVKIGDLGVAKLMDTSTALANTVVGTPYYLSPELCADKPYRDKSDCWALGVMLYECCTLKHPFDARNQCALILKIIEAKPSPPPKTNVSNEMINLAMWLLLKDPNHRPQIRDILNEEVVRTKLLEHKLELPVELDNCRVTNNLRKASRTWRRSSNHSSSTGIGGSDAKAVDNNSDSKQVKDESPAREPPVKVLRNNNNNNNNNQGAIAADEKDGLSVNGNAFSPPYNGIAKPSTAVGTSASGVAVVRSAARAPLVSKTTAINTHVGNSNSNSNLLSDGAMGGPIVTSYHSNAAVPQQTQPPPQATTAHTIAATGTTSIATGPPPLPPGKKIVRGNRVRGGPINSNRQVSDNVRVRHQVRPTARTSPRGTAAVHSSGDDDALRGVSRSNSGNSHINTDSKDDDNDNDDGHYDSDDRLEDDEQFSEDYLSEYYNEYDQQVLQADSKSDHPTTTSTTNTTHASFKYDDGNDNKVYRDIKPVQHARQSSNSYMEDDAAAKDELHARPDHYHQYHSSINNNSSNNNNNTVANNNNSNYHASGKFVPPKRMDNLPDDLFFDSINPNNTNNANYLTEFNRTDYRNDQPTSGIQALSDDISTYDDEEFDDMDDEPSDHQSNLVQPSISKARITPVTTKSAPLPTTAVAAGKLQPSKSKVPPKEQKQYFVKEQKGSANAFRQEIVNKYDPSAWPHRNSRESKDDVPVTTVQNSYDRNSNNQGDKESDMRELEKSILPQDLKGTMDGADWNPVWTQSRGRVNQPNAVNNNNNNNTTSNRDSVDMAERNSNVGTAEFTNYFYLDRDADASASGKTNSASATLEDDDEDENFDVESMLELVEEHRARATAMLGETLFSKVYDLCAKFMRGPVDYGCAADGDDTVTPNQSELYKELESALGNHASDNACEAVFGIKVLLALESKFERMLELQLLRQNNIS